MLTIWKQLYKLWYFYIMEYWVAIKSIYGKSIWENHRHENDHLKWWCIHMMEYYAAIKMTAISLQLKKTKNSVSYSHYPHYKSSTANRTG